MYQLRLFHLVCLFLGAGIVMAGNPIVWPDLKTVKFIAGRAATEKDVSEDRAVFVLKSGDTPIGRPLGIPVPQYAIHVDGETKKRTPCILIQAEQAGETKYGGCRSVADGTYLVGLIGEFELFGNNAPK